MNYIMLPLNARGHSYFTFKVKVGHSRSTLCIRSISTSRSARDLAYVLTNKDNTCLPELWLDSSLGELFLQVGSDAHLYVHHTRCREVAQEVLQFQVLFLVSFVHLKGGEKVQYDTY